MIGAEKFTACRSGVDRALPPAAVHTHGEWATANSGFHCVRDRAGSLPACDANRVLPPATVHAHGERRSTRVSSMLKQGATAQQPPHLLPLPRSPQLQAPQLWMAVVPLAALAAYPLLAALGARFGSHPLWQRYGRAAQDALEANKVGRTCISNKGAVVPAECASFTCAICCIEFCDQEAWSFALPLQPHKHAASCHHTLSQANVLRFATTMELTAGFSLVLSILGSGLRGAMLAYV